MPVQTQHVQYGSTQPARLFPQLHASNVYQFGAPTEQPYPSGPRVVPVVHYLPQRPAAPFVRPHAVRDLQHYPSGPDVAAYVPQRPTPYGYSPTVHAQRYRESMTTGQYQAGLAPHAILARVQQHEDTSYLPSDESVESYHTQSGGYDQLKYSVIPRHNPEMSSLVLAMSQVRHGTEVNTEYEREQEYQGHVHT